MVTVKIATKSLKAFKAFEFVMDQREAHEFYSAIVVRARDFLGLPLLIAEIFRGSELLYAWIRGTGMVVHDGMIVGPEGIWVVASESEVAAVVNTAREAVDVTAPLPPEPVIVEHARTNVEG